MLVPIYKWHDQHGMDLAECKPSNRPSFLQASHCLQMNQHHADRHIHRILCSSGSLRQPASDVCACLQAVRRVLGRMHAREQEVSNALAETSTFVIHHLQVC